MFEVCRGHEFCCNIYLQAKIRDMGYCARKYFTGARGCAVY